jgi:3-phenylpropionate/cinnamic acid dioxygenase small subunit
MGIRVRLPLGFVTRIRDRRFAAKIQKEEIHEIEEKRMIGRLVALAAIAVLTGSSVVPAGAKDGQSDKAALAQDRMVIEDTLRRYVRALDDSDLDAYLATLTDDAKFVSAEGTYAGKEAIRKYVEPVMRSRKQRREAEGAQATATHHVVTNQSIEFTDRNNAVVRAYWMFVVAHGANKPMTIDLMGSSEDYLIRKDGKWLIRERRVAP